MLILWLVISFRRRRTRPWRSPKMHPALRDKGFAGFAVSPAFGRSAPCQAGLPSCVESAWGGLPRGKRNIMSTGRGDLYTRITSHIVTELEQGARPWSKPWNAEHAAGH